MDSRFDASSHVETSAHSIVVGLDVPEVAPGFEWGSFADYLNVLVALLVGLAVLRMSRQTNRLAEASNGTASALREIEELRRRHEEQLHMAESRVLMLAMGQEISRVKAVASALKDVISDKEDEFKRSLSLRQKVLEAAELFPTAWYETHHQRIHVLDTRIAGCLAVVYGTIQSLRTIAESSARQDAKVEGSVRGIIAACNLMIAETSYFMTQYEPIIPVHVASTHYEDSSAP